MHQKLLFATLIISCCIVGLTSCSDDESQNLLVSDCLITAIVNEDEWCSNSAAAVKSIGNDSQELVSIGAQSLGETLSLAYNNNQEGEHDLISGAYVDALNVVYNFVEGSVDVKNVTSRNLSGTFSLTVSNTTADPPQLVINGSFVQLPFE